MDNEKIVASVFDLAVEEMWNEPQRQGLKYCSEDVVLCAATYAAQSVIYGENVVRSGLIWPHTEYGYLATEEELELYRTMLDVSIEYTRKHAAEYGIEFDEIWD